MASADVHQRLKAIRERTHKAREQKAAARRALAAAQQAGDQEMQATAQTVLDGAMGEEMLASQLENALLAQISGTSGAFQTGTFLDDPEMIRELESLATSKKPIGNMNLGPLISRESLIEDWNSRSMAAAGDIAFPSPGRYEAPYGVVPELVRRLRIIDLLPTSPLDGLGFHYEQEQGSNIDTAAETAEEALRPQADFEMVDATMEARTIGHYIKSPREALADVPTLATTLNNRLTYGVRRRVENQIIAGDGTGSNLKGILHTSGIGAVASGLVASDSALSGITDIFLAEGEPNAVILNPTDLESMLTAKAAGSGERLDSSGAFAGGVGATLWGLPAIPTTAMPAGTGLVGDFAQGATLFIREAPNVRISDADQDDFIRGRVTLLGEGRFGLAIWRPACFATVAFG